MLHGSSRYFLLTFYSPFCRGVALIYMKLCGAESFQSGRIWRYIGIYGDTLLPASPSISRYYENDNEDVILFEYVYMQHGSMSWISTEKADIISVSVNDLDGKLAVPKEEGINSTLVWFDPEKNLQFTIDAPLGENDILHIAESVSLVETTK